MHEKHVNNTPCSGRRDVSSYHQGTIKLSQEFWPGTVCWLLGWPTWQRAYRVVSSRSQVGQAQAQARDTPVTACKDLELVLAIALGPLPASLSVTVTMGGRPEAACGDDWELRKRIIGRIWEMAGGGDIDGNS